MKYKSSGYIMKNSIPFSMNLNNLPKLTIM